MRVLFIKQLNKVLLLYLFYPQIENKNTTISSTKTKKNKQNNLKVLCFLHSLQKSIPLEA